MSTCPCGTPTRDDAYICETCLSDLTRALSEMTWLADELETTIGRQRAAAMTGSAPGANRPMPYDVHTAATRQALRHALVTAVKFCEEEHIRHQSPTDRRPVDSLASMSRWLMWRVDGLAFNDMGYQFAEDILTTTRACRRAVDRRPERRYSGPCECGRDLYHKPGATDVKCRECERVYTVEELYEWMRSQVRGRLVTAREGSTLLCRFDLETQQGTIDKWRERGRVVEKGHDTEGRRLYLFDDLLDVASKVASA